jgi:hypothetical protein
VSDEQLDNKDEKAHLFGGLTSNELTALEEIGDLYHLIANRIIGYSETRQMDLAELRFHFNALRNMIAAQAAARMLPDKLRLLGEMRLVSVPVSLCGNREQHESHMYLSGMLGTFYCDADQSKREPAASERRRDGHVRLTAPLKEEK